MTLAGLEPATPRLGNVRALHCATASNLAGSEGFEPSYRGSEPRVLPLNDNPILVRRARFERATSRVEASRSVRWPTGAMVRPCGLEPQPQSFGNSAPHPEAGARLETPAADYLSGRTACASQLRSSAAGAWWTRPESNRRPFGCEPNVLPSELHARIGGDGGSCVRAYRVQTGRHA